MKSKRLLLALLLALVVPWAVNAQETLTVCDGTNTNSNVPIYGLYTDSGVKCEFVIPADMLENMEGGTINAMKFYLAPASYSTGAIDPAPSFTIFMKEVNFTTMTAYTGTDDAVTVYNGVVAVVTASTAQEVDIEFTDGYTYEGGNLLIGLYQNGTSGYKSTSWYGVNQDDNSAWQGYGSSTGSGKKFIPKTTFTYEPAATEGCNVHRPKTLTASNVGGRSVTLTWTTDNPLEATADGYNVEYKKAADPDEDQYWTRVGTAYNVLTTDITGLDPETEYTARVQAACSPTEQSDWRNIGQNFTTDVVCPAPTNLQVPATSISAYEAIATWNGTSQSYVVMIGEENFAFRANFEDGQMPDGFTTTTNYPFTAVENTHSGAYCAKSGNAGVDSSTSDMVLEVTLANDATLTFSAKVSSEANYDKAYFSIDGTAQSNLNGISGNGNWIDYSYTLAAGTHTLRWYFTKDSSQAGNDDCFYVDDIVISAGVSSWTEYTTANLSYPFASLTPNTPYQVKVKGYCGTDDGYSAETAPVRFTTHPSCFAPTNLAIVNGYPTAHEVSFTWDYEDGEVFQYALPNGVVTDPAEVTWNTTWYAGEDFPVWDNLTAETNYIFWLRKKCDGDDHSDPVYVTFSTPVACPAPVLAAAPDVTAHTANLSWTGSSANYNVYWRTPAYMDGTTEEFNSKPSTWLFRQGAFDATAGTATLSGTSSWNVGSSNNVFDNHAYFNMYGSTNYWIITPSMEITNGYGLSFDVAYTSYYGGAPGANSTHKLYVLISTDEMATWTVLREWNNSGTGTDVLDEIPATGMNVSINLTNYAGNTAYIAFYGNSTTTSPDCNIHIDNVVIGVEVPAGTLNEDNTTETTYEISGLDPETPYEAWVIGVCGGIDGESLPSNTVNFTTDIACHAPTTLSVPTRKSDYVILNWVSTAEAWQLCLNGDEDHLIDITVNNSEVTLLEGNVVEYQLNGLTPETDYTVKVRNNCGDLDGTSAWTSPVEFSTLAACPTPEDVEVVNVLHTTATVNWNGEGDGFTVKYRETAHTEGLSEAFGTSIPTGWENKSGLVNGVMEGTVSLTTGTYWSFGTSNGVFDNHAKMNIYTSGTTARGGWLITPEFEVVNNTLTFDLALTAYSGSNVPTPDTDGDDDRFVVLVTTDNEATWSILKEWNNAGTGDYVYNNIACSAEGEQISIDMSAYSGQSVRIAFYGESTQNNADNYLHIDNVKCGNDIPTGEWIEVPATETTANLEGLTAGLEYEVVVVPACDETLASTPVFFTTPSASLKLFITEGDWNNEQNWSTPGVPTASNEVKLLANVTITGMAEAKTIDKNGKTITIEDGGQLKYYNNSAISATVKKNIEGWTVSGDGDGNPNGYYLIANPIMASFTPTEANGFLTGNYDLYDWSFSEDDEWLNFKADEFDLYSSYYASYGYLYANEQGTELVFEGNIKPANSNLYRGCNAASDPESNDFPGWYLMGNGFVCNAYVATANTGGTALPYIKMNDTRDGFVNVAADGTALEPMEGFFYQAEATKTVYVTTTMPTIPDGGQLNMNLSQSGRQVDNAILVFGNEQRLGKFTFRRNSSKVYISEDGKDYAIINTESSVGEIPVSFKAENNGSYTLGFTNEEVSFSYLHLIDNLTGADVDLLANPSYTFDARTTDYASRFKLVFATGTSATDNTFGFVNGAGNFCIFGIEGDATVQVVDMLGHVLSSEQFSGSYETKLNVAPGVYMLRLINGSDVKVQKVIVR